MRGLGPVRPNKIASKPPKQDLVLDRDRSLVRAGGGKCEQPPGGSIWPLAVADLMQFKMAVKSILVSQDLSLHPMSKPHTAKQPCNRDYSSPRNFQSRTTQGGAIFLQMVDNT